MSTSTTRISVRLAIGTLVTLAGLALMAETLGFFDAGRVFRFWPLVMIGVGFALLSRARDGGPWFPGAIVILLGTVFMLDELGIIDGGIRAAWPLIIILVGIAILTRGMRPRSKASDAESEDTLSKFAVLSGYERKVTSQDFKGGDLSAFMGGLEVDLTQADIQTEAVLDVFVLMGGIEIKVPRDWSVDPRITPIMGGLEDSADRREANPDKRLIVKGFVMMGGIEIRN